MRTAAAALLLAMLIAIGCRHADRTRPSAGPKIEEYPLPASKPL
jgi:hypothetical protein